MTETKMAYNSKVILFLLFSSNLISAMDRFIINYGIVPISKEFQLDATSTGLILSIFFLGYAIMQIPGGWLADKFGARIVILISVFSFSIFTGLTGVAWSFAILVIIRFIFGIGEGSFFPAGAKLIADAIPEERRSKAMSIFLSALTAAGIAAPILATSMMVSIGWRWMFGVIGLLGLLFGMLNWFFLKPKAGTSGLYQASLSASSVQKPKTTKGSIKKMLKTPMIWALIIVSFSHGFISWGLSAWMPTYLVNERGLDLLSLGMLALIPGATGVIFFLLAGYVIDKQKNGREKWIGAISGIGYAILVYLMFHAKTVTGVIVFQSLIPMFGATLSVIIFSMPLKRLSQEIAGTAIGVVNLGMQIAGFLAPLGMGFIIDSFNGSYNGAVWLLTSFGIVCFLAFVTLYTSDKKESIVEEHAPIVPVTK
ncbi:MFS transporter [Neobacillus kokaensis]|uniref:MFS transporter n=1 Tax=Neobacillus kokaensis TaxID=2759023 RepID=A0ABQ3NAG5_9BACI|nr:MFS transporter [Neobacillus kokaensis]GHH99296.1 MFS transporter [Neobacillus kokaensis]